MRYIWAILCTLMLSTPSFAGGMSGGTGIGGLIQDLTDELQEILNLPKIQLDADRFRRVLMRLAVFGQATVRVGDHTIIIKWKCGRVVDDSETAEIILNESISQALSE